MAVTLRAAALVVAVTVLLSGCSLLTLAINSRWPPLDTAAKVSQATQESSKAASKIPGPDILVSVAAQDVRRLVVAELAKRNGEVSRDIKLRSYDVTTGSQGVRLRAEFTGTLLDGKLRIEGTLEGFTAVALRNEERQIVAVIKPAFESIRLSSISGESWASITDSARDTIAILLNKYRDNLNGALQDVAVPLVQKKPLAGGDSIKFGDQEIRLNPITLAGAALLLDDAGMHALVGFDYPSRGATQLAAIKVTPDYLQYRNDFKAVGKTVFGAELVASSQVALAPGFLREYFKATLPETTPENIVAAAIAQERRNLDALAAAVGAHFSAEFTKARVSAWVKQAVDDFNKKGAGVVTVQSIDLAPQRIELTASIKGYRIERIGMIDADIKALGVFRSAVGAVYLVPVIQEMRVSRFTVTEPAVAFDLVTSAVGGVFGEALNFVNAAIKPQELRLPEPQIVEIALPASGTVPGLRLSAQRILLPPLIHTGTALMVDDTGIWALSGLGRAPGTLPVVEPVARLKDIEDPAGFAVLQERFFRAWDARLGRPLAGTRVGVALSKASVADYLNGVWKDVTLSADYTAAIRSDIEPIEMRIKGGIQECKRRSCMRNSSCDLRPCRRGPCERGSCGRGPGECDYSCTRGGPFGTSYDDPFCLAGKAVCNTAAETRVVECNTREEAAKAACNAREEVALGACQAAAAADQLACNTQEEAKVAACNTAAELEMAGCNTLNEVNRALNSIGGLGRLKGDIAFDGTAHMDLREISVSADFGNITLRPVVSVNGRLGGSLDFLPYDIGHLLVCPTRGKISYGVNVNAPPQRLDARGKVSARAADDLFLDIAVQPVEYRANVDPPPARAIIEQNPQIIVTCPVVGNILGAGAIVGQVLPEELIRKASPEAAELLSGTVRRVTEPLTMSVRIPGVEIQGDGLVYRGAPVWGEMAIRYEVK